MINPTCPLSDKEKLSTTLHYNCEFHEKEGWWRLDDCCTGCPYAKYRDIKFMRAKHPTFIANYLIGTQPMPAPSAIPFNIKFIYNGEEK